MKPPNIKINSYNIKTDGTFIQWIESIRTEVDRLLNSNLKKDDGEYFVFVKDDEWVGESSDFLPAEAVLKKDKSGHYKYILPAKKISINDEFGNEYISFSLAEFEFDADQSKLRRKYLINLTKIRFQDAIGYVTNKCVKYYKLLDRLNII